MTITYYKWIEKHPKDFQMLLNQWKHKYDIIIHYVKYITDGNMIVALIEYTEV